VRSSEAPASWWQELGRAAIVLYVAGAALVAVSLAIDVKDFERIPYVETHEFEAITLPLILGLGGLALFGVAVFLTVRRSLRLAAAAEDGSSLAVDR
jgi:hypothetical protein